MSGDLDIQIADNIRTTTNELEAAKKVVLELSNELADVIDVIEPALADHAARLRRARMASIDEMRQLSTAVKEFRDLFNGNQTSLMIERAEKFLAVCKEMEEFRACGFLDSFVELFCKASRE